VIVVSDSEEGDEGSEPEGSGPKEVVDIKRLSKMESLLVSISKRLWVEMKCKDLIRLLCFSN
jgi:hypothetical protein